MSSLANQLRGGGRPGWLLTDPAKGCVSAGLPFSAGSLFYDEAFTNPGPILHGFGLDGFRNRYGAANRGAPYEDGAFTDIGGAGHCYPAGGSDGTGGPNLPPIGARLRLKTDVQLLALTPPVDLSTALLTSAQRKFVNALQTYGVIITDSNSNQNNLGQPSAGIWGIYDPRWSANGVEPGNTDRVRCTVGREWYQKFIGLSDF